MALQSPGPGTIENSTTGSMGMARINLERLISRSLSLPRSLTTAMRNSIKTNPSRALRYGVFVEHLAANMTKAYKLGYRKRGDTLKRQTETAKNADYKKMAREVLIQYQKTANAEIKRIVQKARRKNVSHTKTVKLALRRFRTLGIAAPAENRMKTLYASALTAAYNEGVWDADRLDAEIWGFRFTTAGDERVRHPTHTQYNGVTLPKEHPFWQRVWPPLEWNCRCRIKSLKRKQKLVHPPPNPVPIGSGFEGQGFQLR